MSFLTGIKAFFLGISSFTLSFLQNFVSLMAANPQVQAAATTAVQAVESQAAAAIVNGVAAMTSQQKQSAAQTAVITQLTTQGVPVVMNAINGAIEAAVANLPAKAS